MTEITDTEWKSLVKAGASHPVEAYSFVRRGLDATLRRRLEAEYGDGSALAIGEPRHLSGQELALGLRETAIEDYGMLAHSVLRHWGVCRTEDFGRLVYTMIDAGLLSRSADDRIEDFAGVYEFDEAFAPSAIAERMVGVSVC